MALSPPDELRTPIERQRLQADIRLIRLIFWMMVIPAAGFAVNDVLFAGGDSALLLKYGALRLATIGGLLYGGYRIRGVADRQAFNRFLGISVILTAVVLVTMRLMRPQDSLQTTYFEVLVIVGLYVTVPLPVRYQLAVTIPFSLLLVALNLFWVTDVNLPTRISLAATITLANVLGWTVSRNRHALLDHLIEAQVEQARTLAELRTLRGIIPVCAGCSSVRLENDEWQQLQAYVSVNTHAEFSHGLCPSCSVRLYPGLQDPQEAPPGDQPGG